MSRKRLLARCGSLCLIDRLLARVIAPSCAPSRLSGSSGVIDGVKCVLVDSIKLDRRASHVHGVGLPLLLDVWARFGPLQLERRLLLLGLLIR